MFSVVHNFTEECIQEADKYNWSGKIMFSEHWSLFVCDKYEFFPVWAKRKKNLKLNSNLVTSHGTPTLMGESAFRLYWMYFYRHTAWQWFLNAFKPSGLAELSHWCSQTRSSLQFSTDWWALVRDYVGKIEGYIIWSGELSLQLFHLCSRPV